MPPAKKRKTAASARAKKDEHISVPVSAPIAPVSAPAAQDEPEPTTVEEDVGLGGEASTSAADDTGAGPATATAPPSAEDAAAKARERMARFQALRARKESSADQNLKAARAESQRMAADPAQLTALHRKRAVASHKLLKAEVEEEGGDFERKRAWDWTAEESERWDRRMRKKEAHRDDTAFQDYRREAQKVYKTQLRNMPPDLEKYARDKLAAVQRAAADGSLDIVETEDGELIAIDRDGSFYATADSTTFAENRPSKEAIDRLVNDQKKADEIALKKRRDRMAKNGDDADVTYINEKNKQFNQKLARFYNKYTAEIRDSFERGTMI